LWAAIPAQGAVVTQAGLKSTTFLLDDCADVNLVSQEFVLQHGFP